MTLEDRLSIQKGIENRLPIRKIAEAIGKDPTTVSKEIKRSLTIKPDETKTIYRNENGKEKEVPVCLQLQRSPFTCNSCLRHKQRCGFTKQFYYAIKAQRLYEETLVESRSGIALGKESFYEMDKILTNGIKKRQRLYHISQQHDLGVVQSTVDRYLHKGYLSVNKLDFPRVVKFKPRRKYPKNYIPKESKQGRTYDDFKAFIKEHGLSSWVEMDTVLRRPGGKVIMTFTFTFCNLLFGLLLDDKTALEAADKITGLKTKMALNGKSFGDIISLLLTDNGGEFANIWAFINDLNGKPETNLFFCDPYQSSQKARVEKNHTLIRDILPKGSSFDDLTQSDLDLIFSHINSSTRKVLNGKTPYELFSFTYDSETAALLGITPIPADEVIQNQKLLEQLGKTL